MDFYLEKFLALIGTIVLTLIGIALPFLVGLAIGYHWNDIFTAFLIGLFICEVVGILSYVSFKVFNEEPDR